MLRAQTPYRGGLATYDALYLKDRGHASAEIRQKEWFCVHCAGKVTPKLGPVRTWHFAHVGEGKSECPADRELEPESQQHLEMKKALALKLQAVYGQGEIVFEAGLLAEAGRIADVLLTLPDGSRIAGEAQCSALTMERLQERTESYLKAGIDVIWAFEESQVSRQGSTWAVQREWLLDQGLPVMTAVVEYQDVVVGE